MAVIACSSPHLSEDSLTNCRPLEPEWSPPQTELPWGKCASCSTSPPQNSNFGSLRLFWQTYLKDIGHEVSKGFFCCPECSLCDMMAIKISKYCMSQHKKRKYCASVIYWKSRGKPFVSITLKYCVFRQYVSSN